MLIFTITKRINKAVAPKLLSWSLRLHESLVSSSSSLPLLRLLPDAVSVLPLAQRIVSIEVRDDYRLLAARRGKGGENGDGSISSAWKDLAGQVRDLFLGSGRESSAEREERAEAEAERLWEAKQHRRRRRRRAQSKNGTKQAHDDGFDKELIELSQRRVELLEKYVRPALLPTTPPTKSYGRHLFTHHRRDDSTHAYDNFVKWIRGEYLVAKYGPFVQRAARLNPELRDDAAVSMDSRPLVLPSVGTVREAFSMENWSRRKAPYSSWDDEEGGGTAAADGDTTFVTYRNDEHRTIERLIHKDLRGQIAHSGPLNAYFEMSKWKNCYELWTKEYVFGLARYLLGRIGDMDCLRRSRGMAPVAETIILDVGAGDGRLAYSLRRAMKEIGHSQKPTEKNEIPPRGPNSLDLLPTVIATDDGSWGAPASDDRHLHVERLSAVETLDKYAQGRDARAGGNKTRLIVLCSWMPPGHDWTADFRRPARSAKVSIGDGGDDSSEEQSVEEYVLIGEADDGTCGHNWYTWGNPLFDPEYDEGKPKIAPYAVDGYVRVDLEDLSSLQHSRFDCRRSSEGRTVSFRRGGDTGGDWVPDAKTKMERG